MSGHVLTSTAIRHAPVYALFPSQQEPDRTVSVGLWLYTTSVLYNSSRAVEMTFEVR